MDKMPKVKCICETCKKEYLIQQWYFRGAFRWQTKFCSQWCRAEKTTQNNCVCRTCGKEFYKYPCEISVNNYCSRECYKKRVGHPNHQFPTYVEKKCLTCGKKFKAKSSQVKRGFGIYCSKDCFNKSKNGKTKSICLQCGAEFIHPRTRNAKYCSNKCRGIATSKEKSVLWKGGKTSKIMQFRTSSKMKNWRKQVFERDNYTCQKCGKKKSGHLQAHHIIPLSRDFSLAYDISNGITLCEDCHYSYHAKLKKQLMKNKQIDLFVCF